MTENTQPEAREFTMSQYASKDDMIGAMRKRIADLEAQLESIRAGGVNSPLMGQPQAMPELTALTERGAKAWAGVDAQALREGGASPSANAGEPSGHIKEPYTLAEIKAKIASNVASNDYSADMLLQHAMLLLDGASLAASAGSEPAAGIYQLSQPASAHDTITEVIKALRTYNPQADEHGGKFIHKDWANQLEAVALPQISESDADYWVRNRALILRAIEERGFRLVSSGGLFWLSGPAHPSPPGGMVATDAMVDAGKKMLHNSNGRGAREKVERIFNAMLEAAPPTTPAGSGKGE